MYAKSYYEFPCRHAPAPGVTEINFQKQHNSRHFSFCPYFIPSKFFYALKNLQKLVVSHFSSFRIRRQA